MKLALILGFILAIPVTMGIPDRLEGPGEAGWPAGERFQLNVHYGNLTGSRPPIPGSGSVALYVCEPQEDLIIESVLIDKGSGSGNRLSVRLDHEINLPTNPNNRSKILLGRPWCNLDTPYVSPHEGLLAQKGIFISNHSGFPLSDLTIQINGRLVAD